MDAAMRGSGHRGRTTLALLLALATATGLPRAVLGQQSLSYIDDAPQAELIPDPYDEGISVRGDSKIVGGAAAARNAWPWQVAIYRSAMKNGRNGDGLGTSRKQRPHAAGEPDAGRSSPGLHGNLQTGL
jgi:hypothetical protein